jgi:hypothetical protein
MAKIRQARRCRAHRKSDGQPCGNYAVTGAAVCRMHGGAAGQVRRKARERLAEAQAWRTLGAWQRSPAYQEFRERAGLAADRPAIEEFARRLG